MFMSNCSSYTIVPLFTITKSWEKKIKRSTSLSDLKTFLQIRHLICLKCLCFLRTGTKNQTKHLKFDIKCVSSSPERGGAKNKYTFIRPRLTCMRYMFLNCVVIENIFKFKNDFHLKKEGIYIITELINVNRMRLIYWLFSVWPTQMRSSSTIRRWWVLIKRHK